MTRKRHPTSGGPVSSQCTVTVCRGCCCGTVAKHPGVDHARQLTRLGAALTGVAAVRVSDCLDACEHSNIIVISPSPAGRDAGARPVWLGFVLDDDAIDDITIWIRAGGPGLADPPATLELYTFSPSRRVRHAAER